MLSYEPVFVIDGHHPGELICNGPDLFGLQGQVADKWTAVPLAKRLGATAALTVIGGATVGFFQADRPGVGVLMGGALGFLIWGVGWTVYTGVWAAQGISKLLP